MPDWLVADSLTPSIDGPLAPLYRAAAHGELALPHCGGCDQPLELEQARCDACGSTEIAWRTVDPSGTVHSFTTVHRQESGLILATDPYHIVDVELGSGHRLLMTTEGPVSTPPAIGEPARVVFRHVGGVAIPALAVPVARPDHEPTEVRR